MINYNPETVSTDYDMCDRLSEFLGSSINPITESTGLKRKIAAIERRAGIENAKFLGKMLQGMTDSRIHTTGDYDKVIHNLGKTQIELTNELAEVKQKRTTYAAAAKHLQICKTYKPVWMEYAAKPLNQKMEYFNQHSTELQAYRNAAAYLEKESIPETRPGTYQQLREPLPSLAEHVDVQGSGQEHYPLQSHSQDRV